MQSGEYCVGETANKLLDLFVTNHNSFIIQMVNEIPRRNRLDLNTTAEKAIYNAMQEIEKLPKPLHYLKKQKTLSPIL